VLLLYLELSRGKKNNCVRLEYFGAIWDFVKRLSALAEVLFFVLIFTITTVYVGFLGVFEDFFQLKRWGI